MLSPLFYGWKEALAHHGEILRECAKLFEQGRLRIHLAKTLPMNEAAEAHRLIEQGGMTGKIALVNG
jgi:NADPH2:quinone reductase